MGLAGTMWKGGDEGGDVLRKIGWSKGEKMALVWGYNGLVK